jgi:hypothetical protein
MDARARERQRLELSKRSQFGARIATRELKRKMVVGEEVDNANRRTKGNTTDAHEPTPTEEAER